MKKDNLLPCGTVSFGVKDDMWVAVYSITSSKGETISLCLGAILMKAIIENASRRQAFIKFMEATAIEVLEEFAEVKVFIGEQYAEH